MNISLGPGLQPGSLAASTPAGSLSLPDPGVLAACCLSLSGSGAGAGLMTAVRQPIITESSVPPTPALLMMLIIITANSSFNTESYIHTHTHTPTHTHTLPSLDWMLMALNHNNNNNPSPITTSHQARLYPGHLLTLARPSPAPSAPCPLCDGGVGSGGCCYGYSQSSRHREHLFDVLKSGVMSMLFQ